MSPEFQFVRAAACRDPKVGNCVEVATNVAGVVAIRESEQPGAVVMTTPEKWQTFLEGVRAGDFD